MGASCPDCSSGSTCLFHTASPVQKQVFQENKKLTQELDHLARLKALTEAFSRLLGHEGCGRWITRPSPFSELGCQFCERPWRSHAPDCFYLEMSGILEKYGAG